MTDNKNMSIEFSKIQAKLAEIAKQTEQLREAKKTLQKSPEFAAAKKQADLKKKAAWNLAHNTAAKLFRDMPDSELQAVKKAVSQDSVKKIDTILSALKSYQA